MNTIGYFANLFTYELNEYNNPFFVIYLVSGFLLFFSLLTLVTESDNKQINENEVLQYLEECSFNNSLLQKCRKILFPDKGDTVILLNGKWKNLIGHITKYNSEYNDYNIKVYKNDNPDTNVIPKRRIFRSRNEFVVNSDI